MQLALGSSAQPIPPPLCNRQMAGFIDKLTEGKIVIGLQCEGVKGVCNTYVCIGVQ